MWHAYEIPPIDINWEFLRTVEETATILAGQLAKERARGENFGATVDFDGFIGSWESAQQAATDAGWEGDFRRDPVVFWIPDDSDFLFGFVIKQDNNGTTYVISPVPLQNVAALAS